MNRDLTDVVVGAATVAFIAIATRWLSNAKGAESPVPRDGANFYGLKWQIRGLSYLAAFFFFGLGIVGLWRDFTVREWSVDVLLVGLAVLALWFGSGVVVTDQNGITKKSVWKSQVLSWKEISEVQVHKRDAGAIELRAGSKRLIVDSRFVASAHLLKEIEYHTDAPVTRD